MLHSSLDPLMLPDDTGVLAPVSDTDFAIASAFKNRVIDRINTYTGAAGGKYWDAVGLNTKIANRNINVKKVGV